MQSPLGAAASAVALIGPLAAFAAPNLALDLHVSELNRSELVLFPEEKVPEAELDALFARARAGGDAYCTMTRDVRFAGKPFDEAAASRFIHAGKMKLFSSVADCDSCAEAVRAGCRNFYQMNDKQPDQDFHVVKHLYPGKTYDCYGVGLVQPYMMHNVLGCRGLSTLDFDWRIQDAHFQILREFRKGGMTTPEEIDRRLASVAIGWTAQIDNPAPTHPASLAEFCTGKRAELCTAHLVQFGTTWSTLQTVQLDLAPLHQMRFLPVDDGVLPVVFLSNAIQPGYTSQSQFRELMETGARALDPGEKVVFIHHVGVRTTFGIYELSATDTGRVLKTICKDPYELVIPGHTDEFYDTWFEQETTTRSGVPTCQSVLAKARAAGG